VALVTLLRPALSGQNTEPPAGYATR